MIMTQQNIEWSPPLAKCGLSSCSLVKFGRESQNSESSLRPRPWRRSAGQPALFNSSEVGHHDRWRDLACHGGESPMETQT